uniref:Uncharacterized protein n=1 Tax=Arundo donax TaxID=35708 RepID=A0A0A9EHV9_ARUDO
MIPPIIPVITFESFESRHRSCPPVISTYITTNIVAIVLLARTWILQDI